MAPPEDSREEAERIGRELAVELMRAARSVGWTAEEERVTIAAAALRIRRGLANASKPRWTALIGADRAN
jgi:hypothetical protein